MWLRIASLPYQVMTLQAVFAHECTSGNWFWTALEGAACDHCEQLPLRVLCSRLDMFNEAGQACDPHGSSPMSAEVARVVMSWGAADGAGRGARDCFSTFSALISPLCGFFHPRQEPDAWAVCVGGGRHAQHWCRGNVGLVTSLAHLWGSVGGCYSRCGIVKYQLALQKAGSAKEKKAEWVLSADQITASMLGLTFLSRSA